MNPIICEKGHRNTPLTEEQKGTTASSPRIDAALNTSSD